jgi:formate hydrogenlyase subunit 3/multisubunit Na+/H+ antiporter MnhD subunit
MIFLLATLGMAGFPITPTFLGEDLIFSHIAVNQLILLTTVTLSFIINGLSLVRIFARIFLGPHSKTDHPIPGRSS